MNGKNQSGQSCPRSPSEEHHHKATARINGSAQGGLPRCRLLGRSSWCHRQSQDALFHTTHFVLVLPDGSCGQQKAQEEEMDRAAGNAQAKVKSWGVGGADGVTGGRSSSGSTVGWLPGGLGVTCPYWNLFPAGGRQDFTSLKTASLRAQICYSVTSCEIKK